MLTWLAQSAHSAQPLGGRCIRCHVQCHNHSQSAEYPEPVTWALYSLPSSLPPREPTPRRSFDATLPPGGLSLTQSGRLAPSVLLPLSGGAQNGFRGLRRSVQNQPWPGPVCRGSLAVPSGSWVVGLLMPPRLGIVHGPRLQSFPGSRHPGARPVRDHWSRVPAHPCSRNDVPANGAGC